MTQQLALATATRLPDGIADTDRLIETLAQAGITTQLVTWSDPQVDWSSFDMILLHSTWDYSEHATTFRAWLQRNEHLLLNPLPLLEWNLDKRYLLALQQKGIAVPSFLAFDQGQQVSATKLDAYFGNQPLVVKPAVGAGGRRIQLCTTAADATIVAQSEMSNEPVIIQAYLPTIHQWGEYSAIFLAGELSHVVQKTPKQGEIRSQPQYDGKLHQIPNEPWIREFGDRILSLLPQPPVYTRIDIVLDKDKNPQVMEVEVIEPDLFLRYAPDSFERLASLIQARINLG